MSHSSIPPKRIHGLERLQTLYIRDAVIRFLEPARRSTDFEIARHIRVYEKFSRAELEQQLQAAFTKRDQYVMDSLWIAWAARDASLPSINAECERLVAAIQAKSKTETGKESRITVENLIYLLASHRSKTLDEIFLLLKQKTDDYAAVESGPWGAMDRRHRKIELVEIDALVTARTIEAGDGGGELWLRFESLPLNHAQSDEHR